MDSPRGGKVDMKSFQGRHDNYVAIAREEKLLQTYRCKINFNNNGLKKNFNENIIIITTV